MSEEKQDKVAPKGADDEERVPSDQELLGDDALRSLLKRASDVEERKDAPPPPDLLPHVQRKIRQRSRGKFFGDGWSTTQTRVSYTLVALVMLLLIGVAYLALGPTGFSP